MDEAVGDVFEALLADSVVADIEEFKGLVLFQELAYLLSASHIKGVFEEIKRL